MTEVTSAREQYSYSPTYHPRPNGNVVRPPEAEKEDTVADDDEIMEPTDDVEIDEVEGADGLDGPDLDADELDEELADDLEDDVDEFGGMDDDFVEADDDDEADAGSSGPVRRSATSDDDDEDDDMLAPDDVEADLDTILKDRMVAADDEQNEDEEEPEERGESADRLQPKRADEQLCPSCFLLVRQNAPVCPVGDDECPLFAS